MGKDKEFRIKFYSKEDLASPHQLSKSVPILERFNSNADFSLNDLIEYYNIKLYFDNQLFLTGWTELQKFNYKLTVEQAYNLLKKRIIAITSETLEKELNSIDYSFYDDFWELLNNLNNCKNIIDETVTDILQKEGRHIYQFLKQKKLVEKFDKTIRSFLLKYPDTAEIILSSIEEKNNFSTKDKTYFPKSLTIQDKEIIINSYLDAGEPNLNYVRLIENSRDTNDLKLNPKTRLKAKRKSKELNDKILNSEYSWKEGVAVSFDKDQTEPVKYNYEGLTLEVSYSESFIDRFTDDINLFLVFKYLFLYTDNKGLIELVSKQSELNVLERTLMKSKNEYETGSAFKRKEYLAIIQLYIFEHYLKRKGKCLESIINSYISYISDRIAPNKLIFKLPINESSYLEKIRVIAPDFEFLLKQYKCLVDENCIDLELLQLSSAPLRLSEVYSKKNNKYLYSDDNLILQLKHLFFSDQSHLFYVKHFENKYSCLYDLITRENVRFEYFENYQRDTIQRLINDGYLKLSNEEYITLNKDVLIYLIGELHNKEVLSYWNYPLSHRNIMDELIINKCVIVESTLFTRQEKNFFNFYLNKKDFTNGYDLRNKYLHGTNTFSEKEHEVDYHRLLKLIILTILKIEDDISEMKNYR